MKRLFIMLMSLLLLVSCSSQTTTYITFEGRGYQLDESTIDDEVLVYIEELNGSSRQAKEIYIKYINNGYELTYKNEKYLVTGRPLKFSVTFPDGEKATQTTLNGSTSVSGSMTMDFEDYPDMIDFYYLLKTESSTKSGSGLLLGFVLIILGLISALAPQASWYLSRGWYYKNAEPSDIYISITRISGVIGCFIGAVVLLSSCVG